MESINSTLRSLDGMLYAYVPSKPVQEPAPLSQEDLPISAHFTRIRCGDIEHPVDLRTSRTGGRSSPVKIDRNTFEACIRIECDTLRPFHCFFPRVLEAEYADAADKAFTLGDYSEPLSKPSWREGWLHLRLPNTAARREVHVRVAVGGMGGLPEAHAELHVHLQIQFSEVMPEDLLGAHTKDRLLRDELVTDLVHRNMRLIDMPLANVRDWVDEVIPEEETLKRSRITRTCKQYIVTEVGSPPPQTQHLHPEPEAQLEELPAEEETSKAVEPRQEEAPRPARRKEDPENWMNNLWGSLWNDPDDPDAVDFVAMTPGTVWRKLSRPFVKPRKRKDRKSQLDDLLRSPSAPVKANISVQDTPLDEPDGDDELAQSTEQDAPSDSLAPIDQRPPDSTLVEAPDDSTFVDMRRHSKSTPSSLAAPGASALVVQQSIGVMIFVNGGLSAYKEDRTLTFRSVKTCNEVIIAHVSEKHGEPRIRVESASGAMPLAVLKTKAALRDPRYKNTSNRHVVMHRVDGKIWELVGPPFAWVYHVTPRVAEVNYMQLGGELIMRVFRNDNLQYVQKIEDARGNVVMRREPSRTFNHDGTPLSARIDDDDSDGFAFWVAPGTDLVLITCTLLAVQKLQ